MFNIILLLLFLLILAGSVLYFHFRALMNRMVGLNRSLEEKNQELMQAGVQLEKTVQERTCELADTNEKFRSEMDRRKVCETSLRLSIEEWTHTFDAILDPVLILDPEFAIVKGNAAARKVLTPGKEAELIGRKCHELFAASEQPCKTCPTRESTGNGKGHGVIIEHTFLDKVFHVSCVPIQESDELLGYVHTARNITMQRNLERQLVQAQKMEAIATLAGGIAHDFNNILGAILGNADLLLYRLPKEDGDVAAMEGKASTPQEIIEHVDAIKRAGLRAKDLVSQILTFSRQTISETRNVVITSVVKEVIKLLRSSLPATIDIKTKVESDIGPIIIDPTQIHQILMNLATNAAQALGNKPGRLTISLEEIEADSEKCSQYHDLVPGKYVVLTVSDTGHGIPEKMLKRIFDPFFTTREVGEGTGMGLAVIHGIVTSHGGVIDVSSREGEGAVFTLFFPRADEEEQGAADVVTNMPLGSETILFVDDEEDIVKIRSRMLQYLGYTVLTAGSGEDAFALFIEQNGAIDLVITDQTMADMTGMTLAKKINRIDKMLPIILCSGYSAAITVEETAKVGIRRFLAKPLDMRQLAVSIRELLPSRGS